MRTCLLFLYPLALAPCGIVARPVEVNPEGNPLIMYEIRNKTSYEIKKSRRKRSEDAFLELAPSSSSEGSAEQLTNSKENEIYKVVHPDKTNVDENPYKSEYPTPESDPDDTQERVLAGGDADFVRSSTFAEEDVSKKELDADLELDATTQDGGFGKPVSEDRSQNGRDLHDHTTDDERPDSYNSQPPADVDADTQEGREAVGDADVVKGSTLAGKDTKGKVDLGAEATMEGSGLHKEASAGDHSHSGAVNYFVTKHNYNYDNYKHNYNSSSSVVAWRVEVTPHGLNPFLMYEPKMFGDRFLELPGYADIAQDDGDDLHELDMDDEADYYESLSVHPTGSHVHNSTGAYGLLTGSHVYTTTDSHVHPTDSLSVEPVVGSFMQEAEITNKHQTQVESSGVQHQQRVTQLVTSVGRGRVDKMAECLSASLRRGGLWSRLLGIA
ncbi:unnamed protein product [Amoebophrya sp. A25]|nr:unnamed protein product [Amoebophrya sp. A25]|eukprot:GSA25T00021861001.1